MRSYAFALTVIVALATATGCSEMRDIHHHEGGSDFQKIQVSEAPAAVQSAIRRDYPGSTVQFIGRHELDGRPHYHVELTTSDGRKIYATYSATGEDMSKPH